MLQEMDPVERLTSGFERFKKEVYEYVKDYVHA